MTPKKLLQINDLNFGSKLLSYDHLWREPGIPGPACFMLLPIDQTRSHTTDEQKQGYNGHYSGQRDQKQCHHTAAHIYKVFHCFPSCGLELRGTTPRMDDGLHSRSNKVKSLGSGPACGNDQTLVVSQCGQPALDVSGAVTEGGGCFQSHMVHKGCCADLSHKLLLSLPKWAVALSLFRRLLWPVLWVSSWKAVE